MRLWWAWVLVWDFWCPKVLFRFNAWLLSFKQTMEKLCWMTKYLSMDGSKRSNMSWRTKFFGKTFKCILYIGKSQGNSFIYFRNWRIVWCLFCIIVTFFCLILLKISAQFSIFFRTLSDGLLRVCLNSWHSIVSSTNWEMLYLMLNLPGPENNYGYAYNTGYAQQRNPVNEASRNSFY